MSFQMTLGLTVNATSSLESGDGHSPSGLQDGPTIAPCGQVAPPVNRSARQAKEEGLLTSGTYGQRSFGSSASVALRQSLVSKLHQRMDSDGGILFRLTWKERVTPAGQTIYALRASGRSISGNASTGWQTPTVQDGNGRDRHNQRGGGITLSLLGESRLAPWPTGWQTPTVEDAGRKGRLEDYRKYVQDGQTSGCRLRAQVHATGLSPWPTPNVPNGGQDLQTVSSWATPAARDYKVVGQDFCDRRMTRPKGILLNEQAQAPGITPSGSPAPTEKRGQLNAAFSRWLMGYPVEWDKAAINAYRLRKKRK